MIKYLLTGILAIYCITAYGCDICGCYMGITPYQNYSSFGVYGRYRAFNGYSSFNQKHKLFPADNLFSAAPSQKEQVSPFARVAHGDSGHSHGGDSLKRYSSKDYELYRTVELRMKYFLHQRIEINAILPVSFVSAKTDETYERSAGMGDVNVLVGYHVLSDLSSPFRHRLVIGAGVKLKTGAFTRENGEKERLNLLLQPGTGSNDFLFYANYLIGINNLGINSNIMYKLNSPNRYRERIGNSFTGFSSLFYIIRAGEFQFVPNTQLYYEYSSGLYAYKSLVRGTRMNELMAGPGFDIIYKNLMLNASVQFTVSQDKIREELGGAGRFVAGISYNFNQSKYLLKRKINHTN